MAEHEPGSEQQKDGVADEAEEMRRLQEEIRNLPVSDHLLFMMQSLSALALGRMGLAGESGERRDVNEARMAIDAFRALLQVVEKEKPADQLAVHRGMLSQLQMAYVASLDRPGEEAPGEAPEMASDEAGDAPQQAAAGTEGEAAAQPAAEEPTETSE